MKNLSLFLTLSLLTLMGTCTIVKANPAEDNLEQYQNSVILSQAEVPIVEEAEVPTGEDSEMSVEEAEMPTVEEAEVPTGEDTEMSVEGSEMPTVEEVKMPVEDSEVPVDKN